MKIPYKAELLSSRLDATKCFAAERIPVIGGWIVRHVAWDTEKGSQSESSVFVPDVFHAWEIK